MLPYPISISTTSNDGDTLEGLQYTNDDNEQEKLDMCSDFPSDGEDDDEEDDFMIECDSGDDNDDIESYNRWFLQQQRIRQERDHDGQIEDAKQRRQLIAEAILGGIHLTHSANNHNNNNDSSSSQESGKNEPDNPVYSILRSPDGMEVLKVPLMDRSNGNKPAAA